MLPFRFPLAAFALAAAIALCACAGHRRHETARIHGITSTDLDRGKAVYARECAACHGAAANGTQIGPPLLNEGARRSSRQIFALIANPQPPMPKLYPSRLTRNELRDVTAYVSQL